MNLANTIPASEALETGPHAMRFTYTSGDRPLEGYTIKRGIGHGGFGEVYYALSDGGKEVALKLIQRNLDVELRGVGQCLNVKHPNLVTLYDVRRDEEGEHWIVMEYMAGASLDRVIDAHPAGMPAEEATRWLRGIAAGVEYLHEHGIVHRDLKPGNLFVEDGQVKIGDYGLAKFITASRRSGHTESVGTVHYMAPELAQGRYSKEIDLYALGVIFYEMLTGQVPFEGESVGEILMKHLTAQPDLSRVPEVYRPVVARLLAKDPSQRYESARAMLADLAESGVAPAPFVFASKQTSPTTEPVETGAHPRRRPFRDLVHRRRNLAGAPSKSHRKSANCIGVGVGFLLAAWAMAGGVPELMLFLGVGGGLVAGALARYLPFSAKQTTCQSRRMAGLLGTSLGMLAFGWALAGGVFDVAPFLGIGTGLLAGGLLPNLRVFDLFVGGPSQRTDSVGTLFGAGIGILVFGAAIAGGFAEAALFLGIGAGMLASIVITALLRLEGTPETAQSPEAPGTASVDSGAPPQPANVTQDYLATANQQVEDDARAAAEVSPKPFRPIRKLVKFFIWTVVLGFVFVLFASILTVIGAWMLFSPTIHANAEGVEEMTRGITEIQVPEGLEPQFAAGEKLLGTKLAVYAAPDHKEEERFLLLMAFPHGKNHLPRSIQEFLEEELAVVRPTRKKIVIGNAPKDSSDLPLAPLDHQPAELPGISGEFTMPDVAKEVQDQIRLEIHRELRSLKSVAPESGAIGLIDGFASEDDTQRLLLIRGKEQTVTIRRGRHRGKQVVRIFAPFGAKNEKPALLVFGTPEERWEAGDSEDFEAMLESMH